MKTEKQMAAAAAEFAERWQGRGYERGESQLFWADLLTNVYSVENLPSFIRYEEQVKNMVDSTNFIDGHIPSTRVLIEQKSLGKDLRLPIPQSDGSKLNPFQQAKRYVANMPVDEHPKWIVTCNFEQFLVYDMNQPNGEPEEIWLRDLGKEYYRLQFLVDQKSEHLSKEMQVSMQAGEIVGRIYEALLTQYDDNSPEALRWLNILCVRIVFCLYAEDAGIFGRDQFHNYLIRYDAMDMRNALIRLFEVLNTPEDKRSRYLMDDLKAFPYTNGGLFAEPIEIPQFTDELRQTLLQNAALDFDWSEISPTIFGAVFESTLNPETRRAGGMHYTSIENIHKVIDPLFLSDLRQEFDTILEEKVEKQRVKRLDGFQDKLASLTFFDPACGSGNFLTETYLSLRRLENEVIRERHHGQSFLGFEEVNPIKVSINQFYGIEINDFAVTVATTALWISEAQMLAETERIIHQDIDFLPLKAYSNIVEGNALQVDWGEVVHPDYIVGNPPFVGKSFQTDEQKADMKQVFDGVKNYGNLDYVASWYKKCADLMEGTHCKAALVSTNSVCQGIAVPPLWSHLLERGVKINFAYPSFKWKSESNDGAAVHCVIVGFSFYDTKDKFIIYEGKAPVRASNINPYLLDAPSVIIDDRHDPICDVPKSAVGSFPTDGGNLVIQADELDDFIKQEPAAEKYIRPFIGPLEFINAKKRYCLWLKDCTPQELRTMPLVKARVAAVRDFRLSSKKQQTQRRADIPHLFAEIRQPETNYILFPRTSSERRRYLPIGFLSAEVIAGDTIILPDATLYHFGVLTSNVHNAWMRVVCGRMKSDYRYSSTLVYNNLPWPSPTEDQKEKIEQTAQAVLDARALYSESSLADLYDEVTMPPELRKAHQANDRAVMEAYGWKASSQFTESMCVAELFKLYQNLTEKI
ncbi:MAG: class I SAM-dependent DNA methyltransferase [Prevotella sp.]|nr:class I SAM-dependent DNA methyltransferase [Prevotella sp.]MBQ8457891.1 class I SAM-dependent DNA methyltransferase [Prevotella sp.]